MREKNVFKILTTIEDLYIGLETSLAGEILKISFSWFTRFFNFVHNKILKLPVAKSLSQAKQKIEILLIK